MAPLQGLVRDGRSIHDGVRENLVGLAASQIARQSAGRHFRIESQRETETPDRLVLLLGVIEHPYLAAFPRVARRSLLCATGGASMSAAMSGASSLQVARNH